MTARRAKPSADADFNLLAAGALFDMAATQESKPAQSGYRGAAIAILRLERQLPDLRTEGGALPKIADVGSSSLRILSQLLDTGRSRTVESAVARSGSGDAVERGRALRSGFLSRARAVAMNDDRRRSGLKPENYRGDLQMHSTWSDGTQELADIVRVGIERGYAYCAVTDHYALPIAGGLSVPQLTQQRREIDRLNRASAGKFRLLQGVEANILDDGEIDLPLAARRKMDLVVAAPHSDLRSEELQTERMLAAVRAPAVHILGHPRGRKFSARPGVAADWTKVFRAAADSGIAVEIDGDPERQDLDFAMARRALRAGCLFALDSDGHSSEELASAEIAIAHARLAGIPAERIVNCWPLAKLLRWAKARSAA